MATTNTQALFATCPKGLEYLLRDELEALGMHDVKEARAGVSFVGSIQDGMRVCLYSRLASRVLWPLASFEAGDDQVIYQGVSTIDWPSHVRAGGSLVVDVSLQGRHKLNSHYLALRVKDAVVDQFRRRDLALPQVDKERPDMRIHLYMNDKQAQVSIDLAGAPLHQRGWRDRQGLAPLKENLAAAMLMRARWPEIYAAGGMLVDPMCGSGTLVIEAALMAAKVAPGSRRDYFGFLGWLKAPLDAWHDMQAKARTDADAGLRALRPVFVGSDIDSGMIAVAIHNAQRAGVAGFISLARRDLTYLDAPEKPATGLVITNPPYGERMGEKADMPALYATLGQTLKDKFSSWQAAILAGDKDLGFATGLRSYKQYQLFNGRLETPLILFDLADEKQTHKPGPLSEQAQMLANRLRKNYKHGRKRLKKEAISCWRVYDRDLPDYAAAIDIYTSLAGMQYLHIQEYQAPRQIPLALAQRRLRELVRVAKEVLAVDPDCVVIKQRLKGKGGARYAKHNTRNEKIEVSEGGLRFTVNLHDYIDTGLFLDHRLVRAKIRELAYGKRFLNLFAYTGTASVYAAAGGASETMSVDLSATYLEWASANLANNGFSGRKHRLAQADTFTYLDADKSLYELMLVDPPTFSNSKDEADFDVQKDHVRLLKACAQRLAPHGVLIFSNNYRRFKLDESALTDTYAIEDWTPSSMPFDFARHAHIHQCWIMTKR